MELMLMVFHIGKVTRSLTGMPSLHVRTKILKTFWTLSSFIKLYAHLARTYLKIKKLFSNSSTLKLTTLFVAKLKRSSSVEKVLKHTSTRPKRFTLD